MLGALVQSGVVSLSSDLLRKTILEKTKKSSAGINLRAFKFGMLAVKHQEATD
jgi:Pyruvate/2-oxoacid:ferredoxin oxidoreductase gamma subunit